MVVSTDAFVVLRAFWRFECFCGGHCACCLQHWSCLWVLFRVLGAHVVTDRAKPAVRWRGCRAGGR
eukprot:4525810-Pleurochrysis_carterae.AAC.2